MRREGAECAERASKRVQRVQAWLRWPAEQRRRERGERALTRAAACVFSQGSCRAAGTRAPETRAIAVSMGHVRLLPLACLLLLGSAAGAYAFQAPGNGRFAARRAVATNGRFAARRAVATHRLWMAKDAPAPAGRSKADAWETRRAVLQQALRLGACGCAACAVSAPRAAVALAKIVEPPKEALDKFDLPRDAFLDGTCAACVLVCAWVRCEGAVPRISGLGAFNLSLSLSLSLCVRMLV